MSVTEAQRLALRTSLVAVIGEPATDVLMEAMPPIDYDSLATKADLEARFARSMPASPWSTPAS